MTLDEAVQRYGKIENGIWNDESKWCVVYNVPTVIAEKLLNSANHKPTYHIYLNKDLIEPLTNAFSNIIKNNLENKLETFDGCFNIRDVRGIPGQISAHAYALALDLNASTNKLGDSDGDMDLNLVKAFTDAGFKWGGAFNRIDKMHYSKCWE